MSANTVRNFLTAQIKPLLPRTWKWDPTERNLDQLDRITVVWKQRTFRRLAEAPIGSLRVEGTLTIASPLTDIAKAEAQLDDALLELLTDLDSIAGLGWTEARKVTTDNETYLGYDVDLYITTAKTKPEE